MLRYENIESLCSYGEFVNGSFERMVERRRAVWFGDDGSGLIRSERIRSTFFTEDQRLSWATTPHSRRRDSVAPAFDLFDAGSLFGPRRRLARLAADPRGITAELERTRSLSLEGLHQLLGEALVPESLRTVLFDLAISLPDAVVLEDAEDQLGRRGIGVTRAEGLHREQLIFDRDSLELLGYRQVLIDPDSGYAPVGATVGWSAFVARRLVDGLPEDLPSA
jgi:hypothetical protein